MGRECFFGRVGAVLRASRWVPSASRRREDCQGVDIGTAHRIVIPVSITLQPRDLGARGLGALLGGGLGLVLIALAVVAPSGGGATSVFALAVAATVLSLPLGWLFAPRALTPGLGSALGAAAGITVLAVPLGAVAVGLAMTLGTEGLAPSEVLGGLVFVVVAGLFLFGIPLACLTFAVAGVWVVLIRTLAPALGVEAASDLWRKRLSWPGDIARR